MRADRIAVRCRRDARCRHCKDTKEYLNQKGTKIRVFRVRFRAPFLPPFFPRFPSSFPFRPCALCHHPSPLHLPIYPPLWSPGKLRFRYPSDLGTLYCPADSDSALESDCRAQFGRPSTRRGCRICVTGTVAGPTARRNNVLASKCEYPPFRYPTLLHM